MTLLVAGEALMERVVRNFTLQDVIKRKFTPYKNLYEICSIYPSNGIKFRVWRKTWPKDCYYTIVDTKLETFNRGKAFGYLTWQGKVQNDKPVRIRNGLKRDVWRYSIMDSYVRLDNGVTYTAQEMERIRNDDILKESNLKVYGKETRPLAEITEESTQAK